MVSHRRCSKVRLWKEHLDTGVEAWVLLEVTVESKKIQMAILCNFVDPDDQVSFGEGGTGYQGDIVHLEGSRLVHQQRGSWQTCKRLSFYHTRGVLLIRSRAFAGDQDGVASLA